MPFFCAWLGSRDRCGWQLLIFAGKRGKQLNAPSRRAFEETHVLDCRVARPVHRHSRNKLLWTQVVKKTTAAWKTDVSCCPVQTRTNGAKQSAAMRHRGHRGMAVRAPVQCPDVPPCAATREPMHRPPSFPATSNLLLRESLYSHLHLDGLVFCKNPETQATGKNQAQRAVPPWLLKTVNSQAAQATASPTPSQVPTGNCIITQDMSTRSQSTRELNALEPGQWTRATVLEKRKLQERQKGKEDAKGARRTRLGPPTTTSNPRKHGGSGQKTKYMATVSGSPAQWTGVRGKPCLGSQSGGPGGCGNLETSTTATAQT
ncbi:hypothetical protein M432DRAFT_591507 [Thermoascus aurantiacus ATCC 26904]